MSLLGRIATRYWDDLSSALSAAEVSRNWSAPGPGGSVGQLVASSSFMSTWPTSKTQANLTCPLAMYGEPYAGGCVVEAYGQSAQKSRLSVTRLLIVINYTPISCYLSGSRRKWKPCHPVSTSALVPRWKTAIEFGLGRLISIKIVRIRIFTSMVAIPSPTALRLLA